MTALIAERIFDGVDPHGKRIKFLFSLEAPEKIDDESWGCQVKMVGFGDKPHQVVGQDSWQALSLAFALAEQLLTYFVQDGGKLFWEDSDEPMLVKDVVSRFHGNAA
ncbi:hypothetical protein JR064_15370 [Xanthomonas sp. CFBP 8703]|uniref:DUF6968 domain-containing protein n=1 Tax=Xanthomonas bonasiae TaxID=2810351 RepID=A0ABS3B5D8_9XANT|nr:hypothetical protein [Xanthomonas bonasiae]MBN6103548.1 hypothetical protein [Xanthomonas bonasiae]